MLLKEIINTIHSICAATYFHSKETGKMYSYTLEQLLVSFILRPTLLDFIGPALPFIAFSILFSIAAFSDVSDKLSLAIALLSLIVTILTEIYTYFFSHIHIFNTFLAAAAIFTIIVLINDCFHISSLLPLALKERLPNILSGLTLVIYSISNTYTAAKNRNTK